MKAYTTLGDGIAASFARMGADLVVVPRGTLVNLTASLLTVQPTDETLDGAIVDRIAGIAGVARAAPQRLVRVSVEGRAFNLIAFDPDADFTVQTWARDLAPGSPGVTELLAGGRVPGKTGETLSVCRRPMTIRGRLARTVEDLLSRRTRSLILDARAAIEAAPQAAAILAEELGRDAQFAEAQCAAFLEVAQGYLPPADLRA